MEKQFTRPNPGISYQTSHHYYYRFIQSRIYQNDTINSNVWFTSSVSEKAGTVVYAILLSWPEDGQVALESPIPGPGTQVTMLGLEESGALEYQVMNTANMVISLPDISNTTLKWTWVLKMINLQNGGNSV